MGESDRRLGHSDRSVRPALSSDHLRLALFCGRFQTVASFTQTWDALVNSYGDWVLCPTSSYFGSVCLQLISVRCAYYAMANKATTPDSTSKHILARLRRWLRLQPESHDSYSSPIVFNLEMLYGAFTRCMFDIRPEAILTCRYWLQLTRRNKYLLGFLVTLLISSIAIAIVVTVQVFQINFGAFFNSSTFSSGTPAASKVPVSSTGRYMVY